MDANEPGQLSEYDDTAGSQADLMHWVIATDLAGVPPDIPEFTEAGQHLRHV